MDSIVRAEDLQVQRAMDMVREGVTSMSRIEGAVGQFMGSGHRKRVAALLETYGESTAEIDRAVVRAARRKVLHDAMEKEDGELVLRAAGEIASDPEVGLKAPAVTQITLDFSPIGELWEKLNLASETVPVTFEVIGEQSNESKNESPE